MEKNVWGKFIREIAQRGKSHDRVFRQNAKRAFRGRIFSFHFGLSLFTFTEKITGKPRRARKFRIEEFQICRLFFVKRKRGKAAKKRTVCRRFFQNTPICAEKTGSFSREVRQKKSTPAVTPVSAARRIFAPGRHFIVQIGFSDCFLCKGAKMPIVFAVFRLYNSNVIKTAAAGIPFRPVKSTEMRIEK